MFNIVLDSFVDDDNIRKISSTFFSRHGFSYRGCGSIYDNIQIVRLSLWKRFVNKRIEFGLRVFSLRHIYYIRLYKYIRLYSDTRVDNVDNYLIDIINSNSDILFFKNSYGLI